MYADFIARTPVVEDILYEMSDKIECRDTIIVYRPLTGDVGTRSTGLNLRAVLSRSSGLTRASMNEEPRLIKSGQYVRN